MASSECRLLSVLEATVTQLRTRQWKYSNLKLLQSEGQTEACHCIFFNLRLKTWCTMFKCRCGLAAAVWISETWVSASGNNGLQHDWLICIAKIGQTLTRATRDFHPSAFSLLSHPSSFHRDSQFSTHKLLLLFLIYQVFQPSSIHQGPSKLTSNVALSQQNQEMAKTIEEQAKKIEEQDNRLQVVEDFIKFMKEQPSFSLTPSNDPALFDSQSQ